MATISTCLIVKNESSCIERCLNCILPFSDEVIIFDTGSDDGTQDICKKYDKVQVIQGEWREDFAWARNESFRHATCNYIFWVDADDVIDEQTQKWFQEFKENDLSKYDSVGLEYIYDMSEDGSYTTHFYRGRIFRRNLNPTWYGRIHEYVTISNGTNNYDVPFELAVIKHYKHNANPVRNLKIYQDMERKNEITSARDWFYYARECMWHVDGDTALEKFNKALSYDNMWNIDRLNAYMNMGGIYEEKKDYENRLRCYYLAASCTEIPRADVCCALGLFYYEIGQLEWAKTWYEKALNNVPNGIDSTFIVEQTYTTIPLFQLCVIEYALGNKEKSKYYNDRILEIDSSNEIAIENKKFF